MDPNHCGDVSATKADAAIAAVPLNNDRPGEKWEEMVSEPLRRQNLSPTASVRRDSLLGLEGTLTKSLFCKSAMYHGRLGSELAFSCWDPLALCRKRKSANS